MRTAMFGEPSDRRPVRPAAHLVRAAAFLLGSIAFGAAASARVVSVLVAGATADTAIVVLALAAEFVLYLSIPLWLAANFLDPTMPAPDGTEEAQ